jgi:hypothetical protein
MAIGQLHMLTPLADRIDRWATSGKATRILLHPEDWDRVGESKREKLTAKYNLPVECVGGNKAYLAWKYRTKSEEEREEMMIQVEVGEDNDDV